MSSSSQKRLYVACPQDLGCTLIKTPNKDNTQSGLPRVRPSQAKSVFLEKVKKVRLSQVFCAQNGQKSVF